MDITVAKNGSIIEGVSAADKGDNSNSGPGGFAVFFSSILKGNGAKGAEAGTHNALGDMLSHFTDTQTQTHDEPTAWRNDDNRNDEALTADHANDAPAQEPVHDETDDGQPDTQDAPLQSAPHDEGVPQEHAHQDDGGVPASDHGSTDDAPKQSTSGDDSAANHQSAQGEGSSQSASGVNDAGANAVEAVLSGTDASQSGKNMGVVNVPEQQVAQVAAMGNSGTVTQGQKTQSSQKPEKVAVTSSATPNANGDMGLGKPQANVSAKAAGPEQQQMTGSSDVATNGKGKSSGEQAAAAQQKPGPTRGQVSANGQEQAMQAAARGEGAKEHAGTSQAQQQAQELSRRLGGGGRMNVEVSVSDDAQSLTSRPSSALAQAGMGKNTQNGAQQRQGQPNTHAQPAPQFQVAAQNQAAAMVQGQGASGQVQQGAAIQNTATIQGAAATAGTTGGVEGVSQTVGTLGTNQSQQAHQVQTAHKQEQPKPSAHQRATVDQVTVQITKALKAGADKINIHLKPASLGRVDVQLEISHDGRVTATIIADNRETLDMLKNGSRDLARALGSAGLQADSQDLNFNLRGNTNQQMANNGNGKGEKLNHDDVQDQSNDADDLELAESVANQVLEDGRIDIRA